MNKRSAFQIASVSCRKPTIDLFEHLVHRFNVVVVQEPGLAVLLVLFERDAIAVGDVDGFAVVLAQ